MVKTVRKPNCSPKTRAFDTDWMGGKCPFFANRVLLVRCAGTTRFARDFRKLRSQRDPSDVGKRTEEESCVVRRTALPTATVVRTARVPWQFLGPDAGIFASVLPHGYPGPRQRAKGHLGLLFGQV